ncbi:MAG: hypothetical protein K8S87_03370 [Planctomycetes bacterium]|nr:hypothetical protein [Planctomycetota bacterium]
MAISKEKSRQITDRALIILKRKKHCFICPMCRKQNWNAEIAYILIHQPEQGNFTVPPPVIPGLLLTCKNCGFTSTHNLQFVDPKLVGELNE